MIRISITEEQFRQLVAGQIVTVAGRGGWNVQIALRDIGFSAMRDAVADAEDIAGRVGREGQ
ncbi:MAG TPA: hypothetical protein VFA12_20630 [Stellaceae bacterium]|nr:hypothetical protein [Stellaceae bacterium]